MRSAENRNDFLKKDLADALKGLFVAAVVWTAAAEAERTHKKEICPFLKGIAASASFVQARALYDFYDPKKSRKPKGFQGENACASHFAQKPEWTERDFQSDLYDRYLDNQSPANKRVFHLVYDRSDFSGGIELDESDHLKNQPLGFAKDLHNVTKYFITRVEECFRDAAKTALEDASKAADQAAAGCGIQNPL
jgi:hypothetical protein